MPKGKISNPGWITCTCQYCGKQFQYYRDTSVIRKVVMNVYQMVEVMMQL